MKKVNLISIVVAIILQCSAVVCIAGEKIVLVTGEWAPYTSEKMKGQGFFTEVVSAVFKEAGLEVEYKFYPWLRCEDMIQKGKAYAAFPYMINDERKKIYDFSEPLAKSTGRLFYLKSNVKSEVVWEKYEDLKKYKVGGTAGYWYEKPFADAGVKLDLAVSDELGMKKLHGGRFDLLATDELVGWDLVNTFFSTDKHNFAVVKKPLNNDNLRLMVSRTYPDSQAITKKVNEALQRIKDKGIYSKILKKYNISE
ncbi:MAG: transporter substrate-binding domain-containing protein [Desulfamplus sp.]|nr:transporter substrate-binding domain-containing protein [Desulfamplus sp.]